MQESANEPHSTEDLPITAPEDLRIQLSGFEEKQARAAGGIMMSLIKEISRYLPLNNLDGITVAFDYNQGLASVDRGFTTRGTPQPTQDEIGAGVAMALSVRRDNTWKTHIVFGPSIVQLLTSNEEGDQRNGMQLVTHELGHAADHELKRRALGEIALMQINTLIPDVKEQYLWELSHHVWDEYYASRVSAFWAVGRESIEDELFVRTYSVFRERIRRSRVEYHCHRISLDELLAVVKHNFGLLFLAAGYVFGLCDGQQKEMTDVTPRSAALLSAPEAAELWRIRDLLLALWDRRGEWASYDEFLQINRPTEALLNELEFFVHETGNGGLHMDVPIRL